MRPPIPLTDEITDEICERIADGQSLNAICRDEHMPSRITVWRWLDNPSPDHIAFRNKYTRAREASAEADADQVAFYAKEVAEGRMDPAAARVAIDALKWSAGKRQPKKFGDKLALTGGSKDDAPIRVHDLSRLTAEELDALELIRSKIAELGGDTGGAGEAGEGG